MRDGRRGWISFLVAVAALGISQKGRAQEELPPPQSAQPPSNSPPPQNAPPQAKPQGRIVKVPAWSDSLRAGFEAYRRQEEQGLANTSRQLSLINEMRRRAALPPWGVYYGAGPVTAPVPREDAPPWIPPEDAWLPPAEAFWSSPEEGLGFGAWNSPTDAILQSPWFPWVNTDIFGDRFDNPVRQPIGMRTIQRSPTTTESRPIYPEDVLAAEAAAQSATANQPPGAAALPPPGQADKPLPPADLPGPAAPLPVVPDPVVPEPPGNAFDLARSAALLAFETADYKGAIEAAGRLVELEPASAQGRLILVHAHIAKEDYSAAAAALAATVELVPRDQWGTLVEGYRAYYESPGAFARQLRAVEDRLRVNGNDASARLVLGYLYLYLDYKREAADQLEDAAKLSDPGSPPHKTAKALLGVGG